ncbi:MAG: hypothetical protein KC468_38110, partial [Myxococcales bacterium]|nr:hypothetical protein [Myxococcales bacterium]
DEALVDAAFAFKSDVSPGGTADRERQLLERALAELAGPLRSLHTPGYLRALHERSGEQHADDDYQWMTRALQLSPASPSAAAPRRSRPAPPRSACTPAARSGPTSCASTARRTSAATCSSSARSCASSPRSRTR